MCAQCAALARLERFRQQSWYGMFDDLIHDCQILANHPQEAAKPTGQVVAYYANNRMRMDYALFCEQNCM